MPPQSTPPSPSPEYDFILKDQAQPKKGFRLPSGSSRLAFMILGAAVVVFILIIILAAVFKPKASGAQDLVNISGRAQEIVRVSKIVEPLAQNEDTQGLVATTEAALGSDQSQLGAYFAKAGIKANVKSLSIYLDKNSDSQMQTAAQNNNLDDAYAAYLKRMLAAYKSALENAFPKVSVTAKNILSGSYQSTQTLLSAPQVKAASGS